MIDLTKIIPNSNILQQARKVHFIGIGGIGISAIARMMLLEGKEVSGSDQSLSPITEELVRVGAKIYSGHKGSNLPEDVDLVVYTIAVPESNPELAKARELGLNTMSYPEVIGEISKHKKTVAIAGTHGKTTTTAMIAEITVTAGLDPTVVVGSILKNQKSNFIAGKSDLFIVEACEYRRSFLNLYPKILVITNIEEDHLDYYKDLKDIQSAFTDLTSKVPEDGFIVCNPSDANVAPVLKNSKAQIIDYSQIEISDNELKVPGAHNILNARAARGVAFALGLEKNKVAQSLVNFAGTWRRFEFKGKTKAGALVYDDYAHHPTEVGATLKTAHALASKENKKVIVVFQPHLYSRTKQFLDHFVEALSLSDKVYVAPIYAAREVDDKSISNEILAIELQKKGVDAQAVASFEDIASVVSENVSAGDIVVTMGAGDIFKVADKIIIN